MASSVRQELSNLIPHKIAATTASQAPDPDRLPRIQLATDYPNRSWFCIAAFIAFVSLCHFTSLALRINRRAKRAEKSTHNGNVSIYRLPLATVNAFRALAFRSSIPVGRSHVLNPAEVFLTAAYIVIVFVWSLANTTSTKGVKFDQKYLSNRAANLAAMQLPLVAALGTRNNIISLLTGVSYNKLNYLHRMTARVICVLIWVHASGRIKLGLVGSLSLDHAWLQCGILAASTFTILCIVSVRPLRDRNYEIFLVAHFLMVLITLLAGYFHAEGTQEGYHVWPAFVVWGLDRVIRGIRVVVNNAGYFRKGSIEKFGRVEVLSENFVRVTIRRPTHMHWLPGQNVYLTLPGLSPFEAHPFTISTINVPHEGTATIEKGNVSDGSLSHSNNESPYKELVFLVQVKSGFTKRLWKVAEKDQNTKVILEGPYSSPPLLRGFETVVLIAGGSGVTFTLPLFLDTLRRGKTMCNRVVFIWAIRDARHIEWIADAVVPALSSAPSGITVDFRVHVTASIEDDQSWADGSTEAEGDEEIKINPVASKNSKYPGIKFEQGRPDLKSVANDEISRATGNISFNVCGSAALAHSVRSALNAPRFMDVLKGGAAVSLHVESFGM